MSTQRLAKYPSPRKLGIRISGYLLVYIVVETALNFEKIVSRVHIMQFQIKYTWVHVQIHLSLQARIRVVKNKLRCTWNWFDEKLPLFQRTSSVLGWMICRVSESANSIQCPCTVQSVHCKVQSVHSVSGQCKVYTVKPALAMNLASLWKPWQKGLSLHCCGMKQNGLFANYVRGQGGRGGGLENVLC